MTPTAPPKRRGQSARPETNAPDPRIANICRKASLIVDLDKAAKKCRRAQKLVMAQLIEAVSEIEVIEAPPAPQRIGKVLSMSSSDWGKRQDLVRRRA